jgi:hypothetical protein
MWIDDLRRVVMKLTAASRGYIMLTAGDGVRQPPGGV